MVIYIHIHTTAEYFGNVDRDNGMFVSNRDLGDDGDGHEHGEMRALDSTLWFSYTIYIYIYITYTYIDQYITY